MKDDDQLEYNPQSYLQAAGNPSNNGGHPHQQQPQSKTSTSNHRSSINHQDVMLAQEQNYNSRDGSIVDEHIPMNGNGHHVNGNVNGAGTTNSKYSLLQFAAQHFRNE